MIDALARVEKNFLLQRAFCQSVVGFLAILPLLLSGADFNGVVITAVFLTVTAMLLPYSSRYVSVRLFSDEILNTCGYEFILSFCRLGLVIAFLAIISFFSYSFSVSFWWPYFVVMVVTIVATKWLERRLGAVVDVKELSVIPVGKWNVVFFGFLTVLYMAPVLYTNQISGAGEFPFAFFDVDHPFLLTHTFEILSSGAVPPESKSLYDTVIPYHYGLQGAAAILVDLSGLKVHQVWFSLIFNILHMAVLASAMFFALTGSTKNKMVFVMVLVMFGLPNWVTFADLPSAILGQFNQLFSGEISDSFNNYYMKTTMPTSLIAHCMVVMTLPFFIGRTDGLALVPVILAGALIVIKPQAFLFIGFAIGVSSIVMLFEKRRLEVLLAPALALFVAVASHITYSQVEQNKVLVFDPVLFYPERWREKPELTVLYFLLPVILLFGYFLTRKFNDLRHFSASFFRFFIPLGSVFIFVSVVRLETPFHSDDGNLYQILNYVAFYGGIAAFFMLSMSSRVPGLDLVLGIFVVLPSLLARAVFAICLFIAPTRFADYHSNEKVYDVLRFVETQGTLLATNDIRHPAGNFARKRRQTQFTGILGHSFLLTTPIDAEYFGFEKKSDRYGKLQDRLSETQWTATQEDVLQQLPALTHYLVRNSQPHPENIPFEIVAQNDEFTVFDFRSRLR